MPSQLVFQANQLHQRITDVHLSNFPVRWCPKTTKWILKEKDLKAYLINSALFKCFIVLCFIILFYQCINLLDKLFKLEHVFICGFGAQVSLVSVIADLVIIKYGKELVGCCNWSYQTENAWIKPATESPLSKLLHGKIAVDLGNITKDVIGMFVLAIVSGTSFVALTCIMLFTFINRDPVCISITILVEHILPGNLVIRLIAEWNKSILGKLLRAWFLMSAAEVILVSIRVGLIVIFTMVTSMLSIQKVLLFQSLDFAPVSLYRQLNVANNILLDNQKAIIFATLSFGGYFLSSSVAAVDLGIFLGNILIVATGVASVIIVFSVMAGSLHNCSTLYKNSAKVTEIWMNQAGQRINKRYWTKVVRSCRPIAIPAGYMGKVDKEMEMNYFEKVLDNTSNLLQALNELIEE